MSGLNLGSSLSDSDVRQGLVELNPAISFDASVNRPSDYQFILQGGDNMNEVRGGVYYNGNFVCALDRGVIPEKEVWSMAQGVEEIRMCDIERYDDSRVVYIQIMETDSFYNDALLKAEKGDDNFLLEDGKVYKYTALREGPVRDKIVRIGWRNALSKLAMAGIPGVTVKTLNEKFKVVL